MADAINMELGADAATVEDAGTVSVAVPAAVAQRESPTFIARLEPLPVTIDQVARVVINERTGTVVLGGDVRIGPAAVAHGNLSVRIATQLQVSQPQPFALGQTDGRAADAGRRRRRRTHNSWSSIRERRWPMSCKALNALGATPRDIIAIMQALKAAGALRAEIVIL